MVQSRRTLLSSGLACGLASFAAPALAAPAQDYAAALSQAFGGPVDRAAAHAKALGAARAAQLGCDVLLKRQGLTAGSGAERLRTLARDERWLYRDDETGRDFAVAEMNFRLKAIRPRLFVAFGDLPIAPAQVRRMPAADVAAGEGGHRLAPPGGQ